MAMRESEFQSYAGEILLLDILDFLQSTWKKLAIAALVGAVLGFGNWYVLGRYNAELVLTNKNGVDLVGFLALQKSLPSLADQMIAEGKVPQGQESLYRTLSNSNWWQKNLLPTYGVSKADTKALASTVGLEAAGSSIVSLTIMAEGSSKEKAINNALWVKNFLIQGASYLAVKSLISSQEVESMSADADIVQKINAAQIELTYKQERLKNLEALAKRFPNDSRAISQVIDPKDSGAKYLPITTQIIATNTDINNSKELLERLNDAQAQTAILRIWVAGALPIVEGSFDGLGLIQKLIEKESELRATLAPNDRKSQVFVDNLRSTLLRLNARFTKGYEMNTIPIASKVGTLKSTAIGLAIAFFLMLLVLLCQRVWQTVKNSSVK